jgi:hypothetical protein
MVLGFFCLGIDPGFQDFEDKQAVGIDYRRL